MKISQAVILAAGECSRFWPYNDNHKSLFKIAGRPLICHTMSSLVKLGIKDIIVVQGPKKLVEKELEQYPVKGAKISYVVQPDPSSTGDAVYQARNLIKGPFFVLGGHKADLLDYLPDFLRKFKGRVVLSGVKTNTPWEFGMVKFKGKEVVEIVENPKEGEEPSDIKTSEIYIFPKEIIDCLGRVEEKEDKLIDAINLLIKKDGADIIISKKNLITLKYPWDAFSSLNDLERFLEPKKIIGTGAVIGKNVVIKGKVFIGKDTIIGDNTVIQGPCYIGDGCKIGVNNLLRGPVNLENNVQTGAFFEIKHSIVQEGTHFHSGYLGDSIIGRDCRFGAGFITANRRIDRGNIKSVVKDNKIDTGFTSLGAIVGNKTSFGIHAGTMPGVIIGSNSLIGPGTLVFKNIKDKTTFYTEFKGITEDEKS
jgi:bifunctional UDP-N-acetylglucosamine pyrophosphorylase/glucosamine-1-phosphate N-acetyltransferase